MLRVSGVFLLVLAVLPALGFPKMPAGVFVSDWNKNPGFKARITQNGLDFLRDVGIKMLQKQIQQLTIPDITGKADVGIGDIEYKVSNIRITSFDIPTSSLTPDPSAGGLRLTTSGVSLSVHGDWHYETTGFIHISDSGSFDAKASSITLSLTLRVGVDSTGRPTVSSKSSDCSFHAGGMDVDLHGGASWLYNLFDDQISDAILDSLNGQVCSTIVDAVNTNLENELKTLTMVAPFLDAAQIDYTLVAQPTFNGSVNTAHKGEVYPLNSKKECPLPVPGVPADSDTSRMVFLWITEYLPNSAGYVLQEVGFLQYNVTQDNIPDAEKNYLNTSYFAYKLAIPQLSKMYPNMVMQINLNSTKAPTVAIKESEIFVVLEGDFSPYAVLPNKTLAYLFSLRVSISGKVTVGFKGNNITWSLSSLSADMALIKTAIGNFNTKLLEVAVNSAITLYVLPYLNQMGAEGAALPQLDGFVFSKPVVKQGQSFIKIGTDLTYNG
ncbi:bactericidal permeability-increasing protein-like [Diadema setosum]|uniref:bactericidal permeability-increasing protein-like n=1 Tax=Diadema setosum TaxID=31175 RepID=UPI003B3B9AF1